MNFIQHIIEPTRLLLAWQAAEGSTSRRRHLVGELFRQDESICLRYFSNSDDVTHAQSLDFAGHPAFRNA